LPPKKMKPSMENKPIIMPFQGLPKTIKFKKKLFFAKSEKNLSKKLNLPK